MQMAKSTYYFELSKEDVIAVKNADLVKEIEIIFEQNKCRYGVRRVYRELRNRGYEVNHKRVQRIMHETRMWTIVNKVDRRREKNQKSSSN